MTKHKIATRQEWLTARTALLKEEKALTEQSDKVAEHRQGLPWVKLDKNYRFDTEAGNVSLKDLFRGRSQLIVYHFMFGPDYKAGCPSCSSIADGYNGIVVHLENHDVAFTAVSRAPVPKLLAYRKRMGWSFPWSSSSDSDFNFDFGVSFTEEEQRAGDVEYNYSREPALKWRDGKEGGGAQVEDQFAASAGVDATTYHRDRPGISTFVLEDGVVYHCYSGFARGVDDLWGMYKWLDRAPFGRNEGGGLWFKRHDEYGPRAAA
jgi:predicted dithiol-disulfide oxidoreductase (DUF899 family)